jgi:thiosulfate reductase cytochrome b subunit
MGGRAMIYQVHPSIALILVRLLCAHVAYVCLAETCDHMVSNLHQEIRDRYHDMYRDT